MNKFLKIALVLVVAAGIWHYVYGGSGDDAHDKDTHGKSAEGKPDDKKSYSGGKGSASKNAPVPVGIGTAKTGDIPVYLEGLGNITPRSTVTVHTLVNGELMQVLYQEGQMVKKDDHLAKVDDRPYLATLEQAEGFLKRDQALLAEAKIDLKRYETLWKQDSIAKQQLDQQASLVLQYEGAVLNDQGQVDAAKTNLIYTDITSPVTGRVGLRLVDVGNIVHTTDSNGIVVVTELQPITAIFTIPEDSIPNVTKRVAQGQQLDAEAWNRDNKIKLSEGKLIAIDNEVDPTTGMIKFRAEFANEDNALFPSQFVNIHLKLDTLKDAVLIPTASVQRGTKGTFVYLVNSDDSTVSVRNVSLGPSSGEWVAVTEGVKSGDQVIVDGADSLRDGAKIKIDANDNGVNATDTASKAAATESADKAASDTSDKESKDDSKPKHHHHKKDTDGDKG